jgi:hypothetical protein
LNAPQPVENIGGSAFRPPIWFETKPIWRAVILRDSEPVPLVTALLGPAVTRVEAQEETAP